MLAPLAPSLQASAPAIFKRNKTYTDETDYYRYASNNSTKADFRAVLGADFESMTDFDRTPFMHYDFGDRYVNVYPNKGDNPNEESDPNADHWNIVYAPAFK